MSKLARNSLFVKQDTSIDVFTLDDLYHDIRLGQFEAAIGKTCTLIKSDTYDENQRLKLWEIRLLLLLFTNQLSVAKREAINVNNCLYLLENVSTANTIYPLPKNNETISNSLLLLLLKLKSLPNLALVNELYKLTYQLRLKSADTKTTAVQLQNLSYYVCFILQITGNRLSLLNFVSSLHSQSEGLYHSNIALLRIIVSLMVHHDDEETAISKYQLEFDKLQEFTVNSLKFTLKTIPPTVNENELIDDDSLYKTTFELTDLVKLIQKGSITSRILGCLLGMWDLHSNFHFRLINNDNKLTFIGNDLQEVDVGQLVDTNELLDKISQELNNNWHKFVHKVYGLE